MQVFFIKIKIGYIVRAIIYHACMQILKLNKNSRALFTLHSEPAAIYGLIYPVYFYLQKYFFKLKFCMLPCW